MYRLRISELVRDSKRVCRGLGPHINAPSSVGLELVLLGFVMHFNLVVSVLCSAMASCISLSVLAVVMRVVTRVIDIHALEVEPAALVLVLALPLVVLVEYLLGAGQLDRLV